MPLTVQRKVKGNTIAPRSGSLRTKLDPPNMLVEELPNEQPIEMLLPFVGPDPANSTAEYSLRQRRNAVEQEGQSVIG